MAFLLSLNSSPSSHPYDYRPRASRTPRSVGRSLFSSKPKSFPKSRAALEYPDHWYARMESSRSGSIDPLLFGIASGSGSGSGSGFGSGSTYVVPARTGLEYHQLTTAAKEIDDPSSPEIAAAAAPPPPSRLPATSPLGTLKENIKTFSSETKSKLKRKLTMNKNKADPKGQGKARAEPEVQNALGLYLEDPGYLVRVEYHNTSKAYKGVDRCWNWWKGGRNVPGTNVVEAVSPRTKPVVRPSLLSSVAPVASASGSGSGSSSHSSSASGSGQANNTASTSITALDCGCGLVAGPSCEPSSGPASAFDLAAVPLPRAASPIIVRHARIPVPHVEVTSSSSGAVIGIAASSTAPMQHSPAFPFTPTHPPTPPPRHSSRLPVVESPPRSNTPPPPYSERDYNAIPNPDRDFFNLPRPTYPFSSTPSSIRSLADLDPDLFRPLPSSCGSPFLNLPSPDRQARRLSDARETLQDIRHINQYGKLLLKPRNQTRFFTARRDVHLSLRVCPIHPIALRDGPYAGLLLPRNEPICSFSNCDFPATLESASGSGSGSRTGSAARQWI